MECSKSGNFQEYLLERIVRYKLNFKIIWGGKYFPINKSIYMYMYDLNNTRSKK